MTLKELLDKKRAVQGKRFLVEDENSKKMQNAGEEPHVFEIAIEEVSPSKHYVRMQKIIWISCKEFDLRYKIIEILKG